MTVTWTPILLALDAQMLLLLGNSTARSHDHCTYPTAASPRLIVLQVKPASLERLACR